MKDQQHDPTAFGAEIRRLRVAGGLSLQHLATAAGISPSYLSRLERGMRQPPSPILVERLARALDADPLRLFVIAGLMNEGLLREMGVPYGVDAREWNEALRSLSPDDWQDVHALIRSKLARQRRQPPP